MELIDQPAAGGDQLRVAHHDHHKNDHSAHNIPQSLVSQNFPAWEKDDKKSEYNSMYVKHKLAD